MIPARAEVGASTSAAAGPDPRRRAETDTAPGGGLPMSNRTNAVPPKLQAWIQARKRHRLSHAHVQMARELGMNPKKFGSIANQRQERWKAPLPAFIEDLYWRRF